MEEEQTGARVIPIRETARFSARSRQFKQWFPTAQAQSIWLTWSI
jgi:hypothetical protein